MVGSLDFLGDLRSNLMGKATIKVENVLGFGNFKDNELYSYANDEFNKKLNENWKQIKQLSGAIAGDFKNTFNPKNIINYAFPNIRVNNSVLESGSSSITPTDIYSFGNKSAPRGARPKQDFNVEGFDDIVGPESGPLPKGASNMLDVNTAPLSGHYHMLPAGTQMPAGLDIIADGIDVIPNSPHGVGHYTIFPTEAMTVSKFNELYKSLPWQYGGKK